MYTLSLHSYICFQGALPCNLILKPVLKSKAKGKIHSAYPHLVITVVKLC